MKNFTNFKNFELENNFVELVKSERRITYEILLYIQEIDRRSLHLSLGYSSLFEYLTKKHQYSEGAASRRIGAMKMLKSTPEIAEKVINGNFNLTQLAIAQAAIVKKQKVDNVKISETQKMDLLSKIENQSTVRTQSLLVDALDVDISEKKQLTYGKEETVYLNLKFSKEEFEILKECLSFMSHQAKDYRELFLILSKKALKNKYNLGRSFEKSVGNSKSKNNSKNNSKTKIIANDRHIPALIRRQVLQRDKHRCQFKGKDGVICGSQYRLHIHHLKAFAKGGLHTTENLSVRCQAHNLYEAKAEGLIKRNTG